MPIPTIPNRYVKTDGVGDPTVAGANESATLDAVAISGIPFEYFLPVGYDPTTDDAASAMETAAAYSSTNNVVVRFSKWYRLETNVTIDEDDVRFHFEDARFDILDTDTSPTIDNGAAGPIGILVKGSSTTPLTGVRITGTARLIGQGTEGSTRLACIVFDHVDFAECGSFYYENAAAGRMVLHCNFGVFGNIQADKMRGRQTFGVDASAGSAEVVSGCGNSWFGAIESKQNYKPVRYLSVLEDDLEANINNTDCSFGWVSGTAYSFEEEDVTVYSPEGILTAIRSAVRCRFEGGSGTGFAKGLYVVRYATDNDWGNAIDQIDCGDWNVTIANTTGSVEAGVECSVEATAYPIGVVRIGTVCAKAQDESGGSEFGMLVMNGKVYVNNLITDGFTFGLQFLDCHLEIESATFANPDQASIRYGQGISGHIQNVSITTGTVASGRSFQIGYNGSLGAGGITRFDFGKIRYDYGAVGNDVLVVHYDGTNSANVVHIDHVEGTGSTGVARWGSDIYKIGDGRRFSTAVPTSMAALAGDIVWNQAPSSTAPLFWFCVTAGTPGTWRAHYDRGYAAVSTDADFTLTVGTFNHQQRHTGTLSAARTVTLATTNAQAGNSWLISRTGTGLFQLTLGSTGHALGTGEWALVVYDGSAWYVAERGTITIPVTTIASDAGAAFTYTAHAHGRTVNLTAAITVHRAVALSTTNALAGDRVRFVRSAAATGAFNWNLGTGPLKALGSASTFADLEFNGSAWYLIGSGSL